jgi:hypothetical protein
MKITLTFDLDDEQRKAFAWHIDRKRWNGERKATRQEIEGTLRDDADETLLDVVHQFEIHRREKAEQGSSETEAETW